MDTKEAVQAKQKAEKMILDIISDYENLTGFVVHGVCLMHKSVIGMGNNKVHSVRLDVRL